MPNRHVQQQQQQNGSSRAGAQHNRKESNASVGFNIFQDGDENSRHDVLNDDENDPRVRQRLAKESERSKENNMRPELWNERGYGLVNPAAAASSSAAGIDSIVGVSGPAFGGRPPPIGGHQRSGSAAAFDVFVDEEGLPLEVRHGSL